MGVLCCYFRPKMFSPVDRVRYHSHTLGAHVLATVVGPSPMGHSFATFGTYALVGSLRWIMRASTLKARGCGG